MAEQMEQQEALHLETHVGIDDDPESVEDARSRRLEIAILDHEAVFHDAGRDPDPQTNHVVGWKLADQTCANELVTGDQHATCRTKQVSAVAPTRIRP